jgi:hypothetical protein
LPINNSNLHKARNAKNDEFYTQINDIQIELRHYGEYFKDKVIYCNCDNEESNFWLYFRLKFDFFGLKKVIISCYNKDNLPSYKIEKTKDGEVKTPLKGNGDFRSDECIELLKESDIVVTNPPFSLFREYISQLIEYDKKFIIIGNINEMTYKEIFPSIKDNKIWFGYNVTNGSMEFKVPKDYTGAIKKVKISKDGINKYASFGNIIWYTNLDVKKRHEKLILYKRYNEKEFPKYDDYDAIYVKKTCDIPINYNGYMSVPLSFMYKYNPDQFEILGAIGSSKADNCYYLAGSIHINGVSKFKRIIIRHKN